MQDVGEESASRRPSCERMSEQDAGQESASKRLSGKGMSQQDMPVCESGRVRWRSSGRGGREGRNSLMSNSSIRSEQIQLLQVGDATEDGPQKYCATKLKDFRTSARILFEEPWDTPIARILSACLIFASVSGIAAAWLEELPTDEDHQLKDALWICHVVLSILYTAEMATRIWCCPSAGGLLSLCPNAIDVACVTPFWLLDVLGVHHLIGFHMLGNLRHLNISLRLLKLCRFSSRGSLVAVAVGDAAPALVLPLVTLAALAVVGAPALLVAEKSAVQKGDEEEWYGDAISKMHQAVVVCVLNMVTGELAPFGGLDVHSPAGYLVQVFFIVSGHVVMAMPLAIVGMVFCRVWFQRDKIMFEAAMRRWIRRQEGNSKDVLRELFNRFDDMDNDALDFDEFQRMITAFMHKLSPTSALMIFSAFDVDQDGGISFGDLWVSLFPSDALAEQPDTKVRRTVESEVSVDSNIVSVKRAPDFGAAGSEPWLALATSAGLIAPQQSYNKRRPSCASVCSEASARNSVHRNTGGRTSRGSISRRERRASRSSAGCRSSSPVQCDKSVAEITVSPPDAPPGAIDTDANNSAKIKFKVPTLEEVGSRSTSQDAAPIAAEKPVSIAAAATAVLTRVRRLSEDKCLSCPLDDRCLQEVTPTARARCWSRSNSEDSRCCKGAERSQPPDRSAIQRRRSIACSSVPEECGTPASASSSRRLSVISSVLNPYADGGGGGGPPAWGRRGAGGRVPNISPCASNRGSDDGGLSERSSGGKSSRRDSVPEFQKVPSDRAARKA